MPSMSVADNLFLGQPLTGRGLVRNGEHRREAGRCWGASARPGCGAGGRGLPHRHPAAGGDRQGAASRRARHRDGRADQRAERPGGRAAVRPDPRLKARGCAIVYITHKMEEIERIADRITVLRDGRWVGAAPAAAICRRPSWSAG